MELTTRGASIYSSYPLPPHSRSIRILDLIHPRNKSTETGELHGSLRVVSLAESPRFSALSYVWGQDTSLDRTIRCGDHKIPITENCYDALKALEEQFGTVSIWVDAICINQGNESERSDQITLMEEIYSWAETVYIWLGKGTPESDSAMNCLSITPSTSQCLWPIKLAATPSYVIFFLEAFKAFMRGLVNYRWPVFSRPMSLFHLASI